MSLETNRIFPTIPRFPEEPDLIGVPTRIDSIYNEIENPYDIVVHHLQLTHAATNTEQKRAALAEIGLDFVRMQIPISSYFDTVADLSNRLPDQYEDDSKKLRSFFEYENLPKLLRDVVREEAYYA